MGKSPPAASSAAIHRIGEGLGSFGRKYAEGIADRIFDAGARQIETRRAHVSFADPGLV